MRRKRISTRFAQVARPDMAFRDAVTFEVAVVWLCQLSAVWAPTLGNRSNDTEKIKEPIVKFTTTTVKTAIGAAGIAAVSV